MRIKKPRLDLQEEKRLDIKVTQADILRLQQEVERREANPLNHSSQGAVVHDLIQQHLPPHRQELKAQPKRAARKRTVAA